MIRAFALLIVAILVPPVGAGLYNVHEKCPFKIRPDGTAEELSFFPDGSGAFPLDYAIVGNVGDPRRVTPERTAVLQRIEAAAKRKPVETKPEIIASDAADLMHSRQYDAAFTLIRPLTSTRQPDFRAVANLAHLHAMRNEWSEAIRRHEVALEDCEFPGDLAGTTPEQRAWLRRVEKDYYRKWLTLHEKEAREKVSPQREAVFALFGDKPPADAVAIVQQLLLWYPDDRRLFWLLAELYAKSNRPRQALKLFNSLASQDRGYSNRPLMMEHRAATQRVVDALPKETPPEELAMESPPPPPDTRPWYEQMGLDTTKSVIGLAIFGVLATLLLAFQFRKVLRKFRTSRASGVA